MDRKLPIGIQGFEKLRKNHFLYVDKTEYLYKLVHEGGQYFLSRPRRFGKSLFLSALRAYWEGKRDLFEGLAIERLEADNPDAWKTYPVFYFDFNRDNYLKEGILEDTLDEHLKQWETVYGVDDLASTLALRFQRLLVRACEQTGLPCVVLVDEYDKSLLETIHDPELAEHNKAVFKGFFSTLKSFDSYLRFVFITGVTKFSKISIFSDLNHLNDISLNNYFSTICGITEAELRETFMPEIESFSKEKKLSVKGCIDLLKKNYDGYHFSGKSEGVYNPFSLLKCFYDQSIQPYWFETGTPTFLVERIRKLNFDVRQFSNGTVYANERMLSDYRTDNPNPVPLLYQTGYLTITDYDSDAQEYTLGFPNAEVKYGFLECLLPQYVENDGSGSGKDLLSLRRHINNGDLEQIKNIFIALFASIPYTTQDAPFEHYFQTVIYLVFTLLGKLVQCEMHSYNGRIDCVVETAKYVYLFEFKRDASADEALRQIDEMGYEKPYAADSRILYRIGVNFDSESRMLTEWKAEERQ